ncbi:hypothetical protein HY970_00490 [Candidatus Kaiserbacteria bacterium]|nr:hypothetical protein [Candidatus Kaiserbacteria bacterium]
MDAMEMEFRNTPFTRLASAEERHRRDLPPDVLAVRYGKQASRVVNGTQSLVAREVIAKYAHELLSTGKSTDEHDRLVDNFFADLKAKVPSFTGYDPDEKHERAGLAYALAKAHQEKRN